jgi:hypothetical protein
VDVEGRFLLRRVVPRNVDHCKGVGCRKKVGPVNVSSKLVTVTIKRFERFRKSQEHQTRGRSMVDGDDVSMKCFPDVVL